MIRLIFLFVGGIVLGGIVHFGSIILLPQIATRDAYSQLAQTVKINTVTPLPISSTGGAPMPFTDPAFAIAICRYDLSQGPIKLSVPVGPAYTSVSFYTHHDIAYYAINDRAAGRRAIALDLMTEKQHSQLVEEEDVTAADQLIIDSPTVTGLIAIRSLAPEMSLMDKAVNTVKAAKCGRADVATHLQ